MKNFFTKQLPPSLFFVMACMHDTLAKEGPKIQQEHRDQVKREEHDAREKAQSDPKWKARENWRWFRRIFISFGVSAVAGTATGAYAYEKTGSQELLWGLLCTGITEGVRRVWGDYQSKKQQNQTELDFEVVRKLAQECSASDNLALNEVRNKRIALFKKAYSSPEFSKTRIEFQHQHGFSLFGFHLFGRKTISEHDNQEEARHRAELAFATAEDSLSWDFGRREKLGYYFLAENPQKLAELAKQSAR